MVSDRTGTAAPVAAGADHGRADGRGPTTGLAALAAAALVIVVATSLLVGRSPTLVLTAVAVAVVVGISVARPSVALLLLIGVGPLESALPVAATATLTPVKAAGALCFACFALDAVAHRRALRFDWTHGLLALLLAVALVSTLGARSTGAALTTTLRYASFVGLYFVATQVANRKLAVQITWVASAAAAVAAALAIRRFVVGDVNLAAPLNGDPNDLAFILATTIPLTSWLLRTKGAARLAVVAMLVVTCLGVLLSLSRGALLALSVAGVWHAATNRRHIPVLLFGVVVTGAVALLASGTVAPRVQAGLELKGHVAQRNVETRLDAWRAAVELTAERPVDGVGPGNFGLHYLEATGRPPGTEALGVVHNAYLDVAAELGVTGLVLFVSYLAIAFCRAGIVIRRNTELRGLAAAVRTAMVVALVAAITLSEQYYPPFWVLGALATVLWLDHDDGQGGAYPVAASPAPSPAPAGR